MQIKEYLRAIGRRASILVLLPLIAGGVALLILARQPQRYEASVTLVSPGSPSPATASAAVLQSVNDYRAGLTSVPVLERVSEATGERLERLRAGLASRQLGSSTIVETSYTGTRPLLVTEVVTIAARESLALLDRPQLELTNMEAALEEQRVAQAAVDEFRARSGVLPAEDYRAKTGELSQLNVLLQQSRLQGYTTRVTALEQSIEATTARLAELGLQVAAFEPLEDRLEKARDNLSRTRIEVQRSQAAQSTMGDVAEMEVREARPLPRFPDVLRRTAAVVVTAFVVAIGLIVLLEELSPSHGRHPQVVGPDQEDARPPAGGHRARSPEPATRPR